MKDTLKKGLTLTKRFDVDPHRTIDFMGEELRVYATPAMVWDIENTCRELTLAHVDAGEDSVGTRIEADHLGATMLGMWVEVSATVTDVDGRRVTFDVEVRDPVEVVGRARHIRFVLDMERQKKRLQEKAASGGEA